MSENSLRDVNTFPLSERKCDSSGKSCLMKPAVDNAAENVEERRNRNNGSSMVSPPVNGNVAVTVNSGTKIGNFEVEYIESENLSDLEDVDACMKNLSAGLDSKDWIFVCDALNYAMRLYNTYI